MFGLLKIVAHPLLVFAFQLGLFDWLVEEAPKFLVSPLEYSTTNKESRISTNDAADGVLIDQPAFFTVVAENVTPWSPRQLATTEEEEDEDDGDDQFNDDIIVDWLGHFVCYISIAMFGVWYYNKEIHAKRDPCQMLPDWGLDATGDFKFGTCECFADCEMCLYGACCLEARLGDNLGTTGIMSFKSAAWSMIGLWIGYYIFNLVVMIVIELYLYRGDEGLVLATTDQGGMSGIDASGVYWIVNLGYAYWLAGRVQEMRLKMNDPNPGPKFQKDFCCLWCCMCCEIIRHARHIDQGTGTKVGCCCKIAKLNNNAATVIVGQPVQAQKVELVQAQVVGETKG